jgi:hypothetical protein
MADVLSAMSLLVTMIALLYSVWYKEIQDEVELKPLRMSANRTGQIAGVKRTLRTRSLPLAAASMLLLLVLVPELMAVIQSALRAVSSGLSGSWPRYDTLAAVFLVAYSFLVGLAGLAVRQVLDLRRKLADLQGPDL